MADDISESPAEAPATEVPASVLPDQSTANMMGTFLPWWLLLLQGIIALLLGIFLLASPAQTLLVMITFLGAYWLVSGFFNLVSIFWDRENFGWKIVLGILGIVAGLAILAYPIYSTFVVPYIFTIMVGFLGLFYGAIALLGAFTGKGWGVGILGLLSVIFGCLILAEPVAATIVVPFVFGIFGIVFGFAAIVGAFMARSAQKPGTTATA
jgi:uncharacterized membrane protein HdeD (DUF308 family)